MFNKLSETFDKILCKISKKRRIKKINAKIEAEKIFNSLINPTDTDSESLYLEDTNEFKSPKLNPEIEFSWREEHKKSEKVNIILFFVIIFLFLLLAENYGSNSNRIEDLESEIEELKYDISDYKENIFDLDEEIIELDSLKTTLEEENKKYKILLDKHNINY